MGRGRAKAKQQKVARELKYNTHLTDLDALQRELGASSTGSPGPVEESDEREDEYEDWTGTGRRTRPRSPIPCSSAQSHGACPCGTDGDPSKLRRPGPSSAGALTPGCRRTGVFGRE